MTRVDEEVGVSQFEQEVAAGERFRFGANWRAFLERLDEPRIRQAEESLADWHGRDGLAGRTFLDVGSGSGLSSLCARRLGARVRSFDYDPDSVACTRELKRRYFPGDRDWEISAGSALDADFLEGLGTYDVVYSWGVLHHTGDMWRGLDLVPRRVAPGGRLHLMLYRDEGMKSVAWRAIKKTYCAGPVRRAVVTGTFIPYYLGRGLLEDAVRLRDPRRRYREYSSARGMSKFHDWIDWLGGYPYEVVKPETLRSYLEARGFEAVRQRGAESLFRLPAAS
jgi:SAM-dependent methyltransferase